MSAREGHAITHLPQPTQPSLPWVLIGWNPILWKNLRFKRSAAVGRGSWPDASRVNPA